jgi:hypothetical protein
MLFGPYRVCNIRAATEQLSGSGATRSHADDECVDPGERGAVGSAILVLLLWDTEAMLRTTIYRRSTANSVESLKVVASIDQDGDSEIRVTHTIDESVVDDRIGFHGHGGEQWLRDRHTSWTADGFQLISSGPEF